MGCACGKELLDINGKKYVVRQRLGEGGFSYVDLVEDTYSHKLYAVKRVTVHSKEDETEAMKEAQNYRRIRHPNVIQCVDCVVKNDDRTADDDGSAGEVLILLPYYGRGTLQDEIDRRSILKRSFSEHNILQMFKQICDGVFAMHNSKREPLAHRDLKPGNVLLTDEYRPILMDLGSAGSARIKIRTLSEAKTLEDYAAQHCSMLYRAPELFHVETHTTIDERIDVWSLGCLLYAICFFKSPFEAAHERGDSVALAVGSGSVNIPERSWQYSQGIRDLILAMLVVNSAERPFLQVIMQKIDILMRASNTTRDC